MRKAAVVMGSDSDWRVMEKAVKTLKDFGVAVETRVISAHRTPKEAASFAEDAVQNGFGVLIAAAGKAAHLAGALAASSPLPVIGVPIDGGMEGLDALLSTVQMPPNVPVATVGVDGAVNAAILAIEILALSDDVLFEKLVDYRKTMQDAVRQKDAAIQKLAEEL
ncbi:5-(carboxyamino)imidazole ribonucleotide mutase [Eubacteriales bacterium OttesenSCG-928-M02]|nr:5-(carboxyamino)imidazole ribonucleotide mutase [Eubacteriales bacterium OttesenSCG-928-M02]